MDSKDHAELGVLVAEPHQTFAQALTKLVGAVGHSRVVATTTAPRQTFESAIRLQPDVALIDLALSPDCGLVSALHRHVPELRIIVLAEQTRDSNERVVKALSSGAVGALYKESSFEDLVNAVRFSSVHSPLLPNDAMGLLLESYIDALSDRRARDIAMIQALAAAVEVRDAGTGQHLRRVTQLATDCLEKIDFDLACDEEVRFGFLLHDVGKIGIPDAILNKPGALSPDEWATMQRHPEMGLDIVRPAGLSSTATQIILSHHERWDGSGYPYGLNRDEIPLSARVFAVADSFDAMVSVRPYRQPMAVGDARQIIKSAAGRAFDPVAVDALLEVTAELPGDVIDLDAADRDLEAESLTL